MPIKLQLNSNRVQNPQHQIRLRITLQCFRVNLAMRLQSLVSLVRQVIWLICRMLSVKPVSFGQQVGYFHRLVYMFRMM